MAQRIRLPEFCGHTVLMIPIRDGGDRIGEWDDRVEIPLSGTVFEILEGEDANLNESWVRIDPRARIDPAQT